MADLNQIRQAAVVIHNKDGRIVIQVPIDVWEDLLTQIEINSAQAQHLPQHERIKALLHEWEAHPAQDTPDANWWDDFRNYLNDNRPNIPEHDPKLKEE